MVDLRPFRGLRFNPSRAPDLSHVICPPYDVISADEQQQLYRRSPFNVVRLELGLEQPDDGDRDNRYTRAADTLAQWKSQRVLIQEPTPALYLHLERFWHEGEWRERRDLLAGVRLSDWVEGQVLPHERTMDKPKEDRFRLLRATATQLSPVFALYAEPSDAVDRAWEWALERQAAYHFGEGDGLEHRVWILSEQALVEAIAADFRARRLYIADGHHRYETALRYRDLRRAEAGTDGAATASDLPPYESVLMLLAAADDPGLVVLPTHRLIHGELGIEQEKVEELLSPAFHLEYYPVSEDAPAEATATVLKEMDKASGRHVMGMFGPDQGIFTVLSLRDERALPAEASPAGRELDVVVLHTLVIRPLLGTSDEHHLLSYTRDPVEAFRTVREGQARMALFLRPTRVEQILAVAEAGERMPEKSTYFHPKPPTGLVLYPLV